MVYPAVSFYEGNEAEGGEKEVGGNWQYAAARANLPKLPKTEIVARQCSCFVRHPKSYPQPEQAD